MFNDISCDRYDNKNECLKNADFVKTFAERFGIGQWSFIGPGSEKKWYPSENSPQGAWDHVAEEMLLKFAESGHPIFRATAPLSRGQLKSKGKGKVSIHFSADPDTVDTIYRIILSVNQLSIYGAVAAICNEYEGHPGSTGEPVILEGQSIVLGEIKAEAPARNQEVEDAKIILQKYFQQVNSLSPENRLSKFCKEAGFMRIVEVGQYFVTRNANEFQHTIACREYTLPRDDKASEPKGWIRGNTRIGPVLEVTTSFQHFKYGIEVRIQSVNEDNSHSWVRISYGTVRYVNNYIKRHAKSCRSTRRGRCINKLRSGCSQIEGKSKTSTEGIYWHDDHPIKWKSMDWHWTIKARSRVVQSVEESHQSSSTQSEVTSRTRWSNSILQNQIPSTRPSSSNTKLVWWSMVSLFGCRRRIQTKISVLLWLLGINHLSPCSLRTFWGQSHWSCATRQRVDWTWSISLYLPRRMRIQSSFNYRQSIDTWRPEFEQKTICVLLTCWSKKRRSQRSRVYRLLCTASRPILAKCMEETSRYGILDWYWSWNHQRRIEVQSNKIERNYSSRNTSSPLYCESWKIEKWRKLYEKQYLSPRPPPKISLRHDLNWNKGQDQGFTVEHRPVGKLVQQSLGETLQSGSSKPTQSPKPIEDLSVKPVAQEIVGKLQEELSSSDRPEKPATEEEQHVRNHDGSGKPDGEEKLHTVQEDCHLKNRDKADKFALRRTMGTLTSTSPAFLTKRWNVPKTLTFFNWFGESHVTHSKKPFRMTSTNNNHSMHSATSRRLLSWMQETLRFPRSSTWSRSGNVRFVLTTAVQASYTAYVDVWWQKIRPRIESISQPSSTHSPYRIFYIRKNRPHGHRYGKSQGCKEYFTANQLAKKCRKKKYDSIHDRFIRDKTFRKAMIEVGRSEQMIIEMDQLASEDHTYKANKEEIEFYRGNWWIHTNVAHFDSVPTRYEPEFKSALSTMQRLKRAEDKKKQETLAQTSSSSSSWHWHASWWESDFEHSPQKWYDRW